MTATNYALVNPSAGGHRGAVATDMGTLASRAVIDFFIDKPGEPVPRSAHPRCSSRQCPFLQIALNRWFLAKG